MIESGGIDVGPTLRDLYRMNQAALRLQQEEFPGSIIEVMALFISNTVDYAREIAPYWTGTLAFSHRGEVESLPGQVVAYLYLDPTAVNPITGGRPVDYGPEVHQDQPWIDWTMEWLMDEILVDTEDRIIDLLYDAVFATVGTGPERIFAL